MRIRREESQDVQQIRAVNVAAFGTDAEATIVDALRSEAAHSVSLVAEDDGQLVGHIMFSPVRIDGAPDLRAMALAPMAVIPLRQRLGIGGALVREGLEECRRAGAGAVFVVGHPSYYPRFGFSPASRFGYPFHDQTIIVTGCGRICFRGRKVNLSHVFAGQSLGVTQVGERIWLVTFMQYDLGYFDDETCRLEPIENPFGPKVLPLRSE